ncbi:MAG: site-2 protease family protein, partial [bacterium]
FLVIGHEFGHFLMAKAFGMRVDEFAIGFGKRLFSWRRGETEYSVNLVPLGGYNKIYGMDIEETEPDPKAKGNPKISKNSVPDYSVAPVDDPRAFVNKPIYQRFFVIVAGPIMNFLIAILVIFVMGTTMGFPAAELGRIIPGGPADVAGLQDGDIITKLNGSRLTATSDLHRAVAYSGGHTIVLAGIRDGGDFKATVVPQQIRLAESYFCRLGFIYLTDGTIIDVLPKSPASRVALVPGDVILEVDGFRFPSQNLVVESGSGVLTLVIYRDYRRKPIDIEYFNSEINHDLYSPYGFFLNGEQVVTAVLDHGIASDAGLRPGDTIVQSSMETWSESPLENPVHAKTPTALTLTYSRNDSNHTIRLVPDPVYSRIQVFMDDASSATFVNLPYDSRLRMAGMNTGDTIVSVNGVDTPNGITAFLELQRHLGGTATIVALSRGQERVFNVPVPPLNNRNELRSFFAGIRFETRYFASDPITSFMAGVRKSNEIVGFIFMTIGMLVTGQASIGDLAGPVGIATITYEAASNGLVDLINILVMLSVNLAIFNLLPFPALDGGRIVFMILEAIWRRPVVTVKVENIIHIAGFLLLILFALFVTYHDIVRFFPAN